MAEILITGPRLRLRRATESDLDFIIDFGINIIMDIKLLFRNIIILLIYQNVFYENYCIKIFNYFNSNYY
jgi:hypothetical protein